MSPPALSDAELKHFRHTNLGRLLLEAARIFQLRAVEKLHQRGYTDYRLGHNAVLTNLGLDGARVVDLAARAGMTKQSMAQLVDDLEGLGYVARSDDPTDRRAKLVRLTRRGRKMLGDAVEALEEVTDEFGEAAGGPRIQRLRRDLAVLVEGLGVDMP